MKTKCWYSGASLTADNPEDLAALEEIVNLLKKSKEIVDEDGNNDNAMVEWNKEKGVLNIRNLSW